MELLCFETSGRSPYEQREALSSNPHLGPGMEGPHPRWRGWSDGLLSSTQKPPKLCCCCRHPFQLGASQTCKSPVRLSIQRREEAAGIAKGFRSTDGDAAAAVPEMHSWPFVSDTFLY